MRPLLTAEEMRAFDAHLIQSGVPGIVLMENAGRGAAHLIGLRERPRVTSTHAERPPAPPARLDPQVQRLLGGSCVRCADERALGGSSVGILVGPGNNGGDGSVVGRHLLARAADVTVYLAADEARLTGDAQTALLAFRAVGGRVLSLPDEPSVLSAHDVLVDALLGTGRARAPEGLVLRGVELLNGAGRPVVALDVPSGLDATTGSASGAVVRAEHTVTFGHLKTGLLTTSGYEHAGRVTVSHLGVPATLPPSIVPRAFLLEEEDVRGALEQRSVGAHKGAAGRVVVVGGSEGMVGAPRLSALSALRAGAGLVTILAPEAVRARLEAETLEVMTRTAPEPLDADTLAWLAQADALVVGPGLGRTESARQRVQAALSLGRPTVLDADGLRAVEADPGALRAHPALILTPHSAEAAGLLGTTAEVIESDRFGHARRLAELTGAVVLLKGPRTLIATPNGEVVVNPFGTPALATGGSGDVLAGLIAALLAGSNAEPPTAAWLGAALHGLAAEAWTVEGGDRGLLASEIVDWVPRVRARLAH